MIHADMPLAAEPLLIAEVELLVEPVARGTSRFGQPTRYILTAESKTNERAKAELLNRLRPKTVNETDLQNRNLACAMVAARRHWNAQQDDYDIIGVDPFD